MADDDQSWLNDYPIAESQPPQQTNQDTSWLKDYPVAEGQQAGAQGEEPSTLGSFVHGIGRGAIPGTAAIAGAVQGAEVGGALGTAVAPGPGTVVGGFLGAVGGGLAGGYLGGKAQNTIADTLGLDSPESRERDVTAHPYAEQLGEAVPMLGSLSTSGKLAARIAAGGVMGSFDVINQGVSKGFGNIDPTEALIAGGVGAAAPTPRGWIGGKGAGLGQAGAAAERPTKFFGDQAAANAGASPEPPAPQGDHGVVKTDGGPAGDPAVQAVFQAKTAPSPGMDVKQGPGEFQSEGLDMAGQGVDEGLPRSRYGTDTQQTPPLTPEQVEARRAELAAAPAPPMTNAQGRPFAPQARDLTEPAPPARPPIPPELAAGENLHLPGFLQRARPAENIESQKIPAAEVGGQNENIQPAKPTQIQTGANPTTTLRGAPLRAKGYQNWDVGQKVSVGFQKDLEVVSRNEDGSFTLRAPSGKNYDFVPQQGIFEKPGATEEAAIAEMPRPQSLGAAAKVRTGLEGPQPEPVGATKLKSAGLWQRANDAFDRAFGGAKMFLAPQTVSDQGAQADKIVTAHFGQDTKALAQHQQGIDAIQTYFDRMTPEQRTSAVTDYEAGNIDQNHPGAQYMNKAHEASNELDHKLTEVGATNTYNRASLPSFFDPAQKTSLTNDMIQFHEDNGRYPTLGELVKAGYQLKDDLRMADGSPNVNNVIQQANFMKYKNILNSGIVKDMIQGKPAEPGMAALDPLLHSAPGDGLVPIDKRFTNDVQYYGAQEVKNVLERYLDPSIRDPTVRSAYESYMKLKSASTQASLIGGIYHFRFMTLEAPINEINAGIQRMLKNPGGGLKDIAKAPAAAFSLYKTGKNAIFDGILHPESVKDPYMRVANDLLAEGGEAPFRIRGMGVTPELETGAVKGLASAWKPAFQEFKRDLVQSSLKAGGKYKAGDYGGAAKDISLGSLKTLSDAMQLLMHPLFNHYIPLLKAGANRANMIRFLADNPGLSHDQYVETARRFVRQTDNAMGELNQSTIYAPAYVKAIGNAAMVSPGWNIGSAKTFLGGARAFVRNPKALFTGADLDPRIGYIPAFVAATALYNIGAQLLHGQGPPQDLTDAAFPRTGGKTKHGNPEREIQPGYEKDVAEVSHIVGGPEPMGPAFAKYMYNKLEGLPRSAIDAFIFNQNFAGKQIANPNDPLYKRLEAYAGYVMKNAMVPIMIQQMTHEEKNKQTNIGPVEKFFGNRHAPEQWQDPAAYQQRVKKEADKQAKDAQRFHQRTGY